MEAEAFSIVCDGCGLPASPEHIAAIAKALPLLEKGAAGHVAQRTCFSCHHQALPVLALKLARQRGFEGNLAEGRRHVAPLGCPLKRSHHANTGG